jgi:hypothetical protein
MMPREIAEPLAARIDRAVALARQDGAPFDDRLAGWIRSNCITSSESAVFGLMLAMQAHAAEVRS